MTLVEVLVGMTVASAALAMGFGALAALRDNATRADDAARLGAVSGGVRATLFDWLSFARVRPEGSTEFRGIDGTVDGFGDARLTFITTAPTPLRLRETHIALSIDRDDETPERGLVAELWEERGTHPIRIELAPAAAGLRIRYLSGVSGDDRWLPSWISSTVPPRAIDLHIEALSPDSLPRLLRRPIRVPIGGAR
jgi:hypothetical protein